MANPRGEDLQVARPAGFPEFSETSVRVATGCRARARAIFRFPIRLSYLLPLAILGCTKPGDSDRPGCPAMLSADECVIRERLGVPLDAERVMIFTQSSQLDIDWQNTFDGYYGAYVETALSGASALLASQPRAYYSIAEMAFLQRHLETHPEELDTWRSAADRGAVRIAGGGMTSPDTLLPETELLARDWLYGLSYADDTLGTTPVAAWLPDSFGHSATAPDVLAAAGFTSVAFSRVDGARTQLEQLTRPDQPIRPGSTAEFIEQQGSADFWWHGTGGSTVLAHYMAQPRLYCAGDNIDYDEGLEVPGGHIGPFTGGDPTFTDGRIDQYIAESAPYAKTPYMDVPVGCDFEAPKDGLIGYLDGYDQRQYPTTGVWAVAAPFEDYAALVTEHGDQLPDVTGEISPYFMGFYGTRPGVKRAVRDAARPFFVAEAFAVALGDDGRARVLAAAPALEKLSRADHHDWVTGTANDEVVQTEQMPQLAEAEAAGDAELAGVAAALSARIPLSNGAIGRVLALNASSAQRTAIAAFAWTGPPIDAIADGHAVPLACADGTCRVQVVDLPSFGWRAIDLVPGTDVVPPVDAVAIAQPDADTIVVSNAAITARFTRADGRFALTSLTLGGSEALAGPSFAIATYADQGGLWRMGHEMQGCTYTAVDPASATDTVEMVDDSPLFARVVFRSSDGDAREVSLGAGETGIDVSATLAAAEGTTRTVSWDLAAPADAALRTSAPGGSALRPAQRDYTPTYWPAVGWAQVGDLAVLLRQSTGVRMDHPGQIELIAARDARKERCDQEGGTGSDPDAHRFEWRLERASTASAAEIAGQAFDRPIVLANVGVDQASNPDLPVEGSLARIDSGGAISTIKPAERGTGAIVRVLAMDGPATVHLVARYFGDHATSVDLAERDLSDLGAAGGTLTFDPADGPIRTVRLTP